MIQTLRQDLASLPMQHIAPADWGDAKGQAAEEPKKRRGGWLKGKKRKPPRDLSVPQAPTTGYVMFLNEQESQLRAGHPDLPFTEITKMLVAQWAQLSCKKKQRYIYGADEDKRRYIRELQAYRSSAAHWAFLRRRGAQALCGTPGGESQSESPDFLAVDKQQQWLEVEPVGLRTYGLAPEKEFENLNTVLTLSRFGLHLMDAGAFLCGHE